MIAAAVLAGAIALTPGAVHPADMQAAHDMRGFEPSLYQGKWYSKKWERNRKCIMKRESRFNYRAANKRSSARGAYQFLDRSWRESLVHMLRPEIKRDYPHRRETLESLTGKSIHKWPAFYQDAAWYTVVVKHDGINHWAPVPSACR